MTFSSFTTGQVSGLRSGTRLGFALLTVVALLLSVLVPTQGAKAADVVASSVSSVSPATGLSSGSTRVTITGTNLSNTTTVQFGNSYGTALTNVSSTSVTVTTPSGSGVVDVRINTALGSVTVKNGFTYKTNTVSTVNQVSPAAGPAAGFNTVTLTGTNLRGTQAVSFGSVAAVSFTVVSDSQITAVVPAGITNSSVLVNATNASGLQTTVATYKYSSTVCSPKTYLTTTFKNRSATLSATQKTEIRVAADELISLGCDQVNLVKYTGSKKRATASYKAYIDLSNKRADAVYGVFVKRVNAKSKTMKVNIIKRSTQISQAKKAVYDSYKPYRKVLLAVSRTDAVAGIYPAAGSVSGGGAVTITGTGFGTVAAAGAIKFGNVASPSYVINAAGDTIVATVPAGVTGQVTVSIQQGVYGTSTAKTLFTSYTYVAAPTATVITPSSGPIAGGNTVTITGTGFTGVKGVSGVQFGGVNALSYTVNSTTITAIAPANTAGSKTITITGAAGSTSISYNYVAAPTITNITPNVGTINGGDVITITGTGFTGATASTILFGSANPTNVTVNPAGTQITATTPARSTGAVNLTITSTGGSNVLNNGFGYGAAITAVSPTTGPTGAGQPVTITGIDFPILSSIYAVTFGAPTGGSFTGLTPSAPEMATSVNRVSATSITAVAPARAAGTTSIRLYTTSSSYVELAAAYTFVAPTITSVTPSTRALTGTTTITIVGTGFGTITSGITRTVTVGGATCATPTVTVDHTTLTCLSAASTAGAKDVVVTISGNPVTAAGGITYVPAPTVTSLDITEGTAGTEVVITGTGFITGTTVTFGGTAASAIVTNSTTLTVSVPAHAEGIVDVVVTNTGGTVTSSNAFTYTNG